jgi:hypothetical protein
MLRALRHFLFLLVAFAIVGGTTSGLARAGEYGDATAMTSMPCGMSMMMTASGHSKPMAPCKGGMTSDCIKQMSCVDLTALPARFQGHEKAMAYSFTSYWPSQATLVSLDPEPEPIPPRTA